MDIKNIAKSVQEKTENLLFVKNTGWSVKKIAIAAGGILAVIIALIITLCALSNTYKTPVKNEERLENRKKGYSIETYADSLLNGFAKKEAKAYLKALLKADPDFGDEFKDATEESAERRMDMYGEDYKVSMKITDSEKMEKKDLRLHRQYVHQMGKNLMDRAEYFDDYDSDDWEDYADEMDISKSEAKRIVSDTKSFAKKLKQAEISKGYTLDVTQTISGSELDEPEEVDLTIDVIMIDGRWVRLDSISGFLSLG